MGTADTDEGSASDGRERARGVGRDVERIDSRKKVTGRAVYGSDLDREDLLYAAVLRSNRTHARLTDVDTSGAEAMDGVAAAVARTDVKGPFDDRVRHYGDLIAAVAAEDPETARRAVGAIDHDLEALDPVFDAREAVREGAPVLHDNNPDHGQHTRHGFDVDNDEWVNNLDDYHAVSVGDVEAGFDEADFVLEGTYRSPRVDHCNLDTHCCIAEWDGGVLDVAETLGSPGRGAEEIAAFLGLDPDEVRVRSPPTASSSFGGRSLRKPSLEPVAATLSRLAGRPVKLWFDREEEFVATETRHRTYYTFRTGVTESGDITAVTLDVVTDTGAYPNGVGHIVLTNSQDRPLDIYDVPNYEYEGVSVYTNNVPAGEYRGIGSTQMTFAFESHLDEIARRTGIDPFELRRRNFVEEGHPRPHTGVPIESCGVEECLDRGWERFRERRRGPSDDPDAVRGWGFAAGTHTTASGGYEGKDSSEARLVLGPDGRVEADTGAIEHGQGSDTVIAQVVAEEAGIPPADVDVAPMSTADDLDDLLGSIASRTTYIIGAAVRDAARALDRELRDRAADAFGVDPEAVSIEDGVARAPDGESLPVGDLAGDGVAVVGRAESAHTPPSYGVHFAEVEVDRRTGRVDVLTYVAAQDVGFAVNPRMVEGQLEGAVLHGTEFALFSELKLDRGTPVNATLADYPTITPLEMPDDLSCVIVESNEASGPYGAKGIGTPAMPPIAPALLNALRDATGTRFRYAPVGSEEIHTSVADDLDAGGQP